LSQSRLLLLTRYSATAPSSRIRHFAFVEALCAAGYDVTIHSLLDDNQISAVYESRRRPIGPLTLAYLRRLALLLGNRPWDIVWIEKEVWPYMPFLLERSLLTRARHVVLDLDDPWFLRYELFSPPMVRRLLSRKIISLARFSDIVTASNENCAHQIRSRGGPPPTIVPPYVDLAPYDALPVRGPAMNDMPVVGWIGTPESGNEYLPLITSALNRLSESKMCRVVLIGAGDQVPALQAERRDWSLGTEAADVAGFDLLVAPYGMGPWEQAKSGYKILQAFAAGIPVVASRVGFIATLVTHGVDGMLVDNSEELWEVAIRQLLADRNLRHRMGQAGRRKVETSYSPEKARAAILTVMDGLRRNNMRALSDVPTV